MGNLELNRAAECNRSARAIALLTQSDEIRTECTTRRRRRLDGPPPRGGEPAARAVGVPVAARERIFFARSVGRRMTVGGVFSRSDTRKII